MLEIKVEVWEKNKKRHSGKFFLYSEKQPLISAIEQHIF